MKTIQSLNLHLIGRHLPAVARTLAVLGLASAVTLPWSGGAADKSPAQENPGDLEVVNGSLLWTGPKRKDNATKLDATLNNIVDLLREQHPDANFILAPGLANVGISDFKLRNANAPEALQAICIASGSTIGWRDGSAVTGSIDPTTGLPVAASGPPAKPMYVLFELPPSDYDATGSVKPKLQVEAFSIAGYIEFLMHKSDAKDQKKVTNEVVEEIQNMIAETVRDYQNLSRELNHARAASLRRPTIRFHSGANLIVVTGEPEAVALAGKVIEALPGAQKSGGSNLFGAPGGGQPWGRYGVPGSNPSLPGNAEPFGPPRR
jgi:hypothetical protein